MSVVSLLGNAFSLVDAVNGGLPPRPVPAATVGVVNNETKPIGKAVNHAANSALGSVVNPILRDLKYAAIWVGLLIVGLALIFEGLFKSSVPQLAPSTLLAGAAA